MAEAVFYSEGRTIDHTPGSALAEGQVVVINDMVCVAVRAIAANALGAVACDGVWLVPKAAGSALNQGVIIYWDDTNNRVTTTASGNKRFGHVAVAAASADTTVYCRLQQV